MAKPKLTKSEKVREMLARSKSATIPSICTATGWQTHSAHALLSGFRKAGSTIERQPNGAGKASIYRITASPDQGA